MMTAITKSYLSRFHPVVHVSTTRGTWLGTGRRSDESTTLVPLDEPFTDESIFDSAQPLTVRFRGAMIEEDRDPGLRADNDLLVVTKFQFGSEPPLDRLHYMGSDDPTGWQGDFFRDTILSVRDLTKEELTVRVQVYDVDGVDSGLVDAVASVSSHAAVTFPQLTPYAAAAGLGVRPVVELVNNVDDHDVILDSRMKLEIAEPRTRTTLLQPGYFVHFDGEVPDPVTLGRDLRVRTEDGAEYTDGSYAVLEVRREFVESRDWEIDQKAAKLIAELDGKGQSGKAPLEFLEDTLAVYSDHRRLDRAEELRSKEDLSPDEEALLEELRNDPDLRPFLQTE